MRCAEVYVCNWEEFVYLSSKDYQTVWCRATKFDIQWIFSFSMLRSTIQVKGGFLKTNENRKTEQWDFFCIFFVCLAITSVIVKQIYIWGIGFIYLKCLNIYICVCVCKDI